MILDLNEFNQLSNKVYDIDPLKESNGQEGKNLDGTNYKVLDIFRNGTYGDKNQPHAGDDSCTKLYRSKLC